MANLNISLADVSNTAARIRNLNAQMYETLNQMKRDMNLLDASWISDGGTEIRTRFNMFANRFEKQRAVIEAYAKFLDLTVSTYDSLETSITGNASSIQY